LRGSGVLKGRPRDMRTLSIQFQPRRSPSLPAAKVLTVLAQSVASDASVLHFEVHKGTDRGPYVNYHFVGRNRSLSRIWSLVSRRALRHRAIGAALRRGSVVTCQGSLGWDNYKLLHHFDPKVPLDELRSV
jgi:hypothetical protein